LTPGSRRRTGVTFFELLDTLMELAQEGLDPKMPKKDEDVFHILITHSSME